ncbi:MAG: hypothetical protein OEY49_17340, partial [Candidatus Heimdallarchaeota archaeon]|nr:hypothetical protein [Candidatus Heimdallarchaeota archaeon]
SIFSNESIQLPKTSTISFKTIIYVSVTIIMTEIINFLSIIKNNEMPFRLNASNYITSAFNVMKILFYLIITYYLYFLYSNAGYLESNFNSFLKFYILIVISLLYVLKDILDRVIIILTRFLFNIIPKLNNKKIVTKAILSEIRSYQKMFVSSVFIIMFMVIYLFYFNSISNEIIVQQEKFENPGIITVDETIHFSDINNLYGNITEITNKYNYQSAYLTSDINSINTVLNKPIYLHAFSDNFVSYIEDFVGGISEDLKFSFSKLLEEDKLIIPENSVDLLNLGEETVLLFDNVYFSVELNGYYQVMPVLLVDVNKHDMNNWIINEKTFHKIYSSLENRDMVQMRIFIANFKDDAINKQFIEELKNISTNIQINEFDNELGDNNAIRIFFYFTIINSTILLLINLHTYLELMNERKKYSSKLLLYLGDKGNNFDHISHQFLAQLSLLTILILIPIVNIFNIVLIRISNQNVYFYSLHRLSPLIIGLGIFMISLISLGLMNLGLKFKLKGE